jgi:5-methylcytosine-specific restriction enzyme subunit McrC
MVTDIVLDPPDQGRRVVIDTKFSSILTSGRFGDASLKSGYLYQMYAYVRSQEGRDSRWDRAAGLFLHPAIDGTLHEHVVIQNHPITFATVDLSRSTAAIRNELREDPSWPTADLQTLATSVPETIAQDQTDILGGACASHGCAR